jgi:hypothetical protein
MPTQISKLMKWYLSLDPYKVLILAHLGQYSTLLSGILGLKDIHKKSSRSNMIHLMLNE